MPSSQAHNSQHLLMNCAIHTLCSLPVSARPALQQFLHCQLHHSPHSSASCALLLTLLPPPHLPQQITHHHNPKTADRAPLVRDRAEYERLYKWSIDDPQDFWGNMAQDYFWAKKVCMVVEWCACCE